MSFAPPTRGIALGSAIAIAIALSSAALTRAADDDPGRDAAAAWVAFARSCAAASAGIEADADFEEVAPDGAARPAGKGLLKLARGGRLRLERGEPAPFVLVSDGRRVRAWAPKEELVVEEPFEGSAVAAAFSLALGAPGELGDRAFRWIGGAAAPNGSGSAAIALAPPPRSPFAAAIALTLEPRCPAVKRIVLADRIGRAIRVTLSNARPLAFAAKGAFELGAPKRLRAVRP